MTPTDSDAYVGLPLMFMPKYDEIHISCCFTWDIPKAKELENEWREVGVCKIGGPALTNLSVDSYSDRFYGGRYLKKGITITSRGCPNNCSFCFVPRREGKIRTLPIVEGNIIQDNNLTACPIEHIDKVFNMLKNQRGVVFQGGIESTRVNDYFVEKLRSISLKEVWLAYDHDNADKPLKKAVDKLNLYFKRDKIRCYVLIGYKDDTIEKAEIRLRKAWEIGTLPFAMLYRDENNSPHTKEWKRFQRLWARPAIIKKRMAK
jgi:hypothetical protein